MAPFADSKRDTMDTLQVLRERYDSDPRLKLICRHAHQALGSADESLPMVVNETDYPQILIVCAECRDELQELKRRNRAFTFISKDIPEFPNWSWFLEIYVQAPTKNEPQVTS
jgi:hypothetical protein